MPQTKATPAQAPSRAALPLWRISDGQPPGKPFVAVVPGVDAPLMVLSLPSGLKGAAREEVANRQAYDRIGNALELRPARFGRGDGWTRAVVARRGQVLEWRAALGAGASRCRAIVPDYAALATAPGLWVLAHDGATIRARLGPYDGFTAEPDLAVAQVTLALHQVRSTQAMPRVILWTGPRDPRIEALFQGIPIHANTAELPGGFAPQSFAFEELALDFLRDARADAMAIERQIRRLLWPLALIGLGIAGWAGATSLAARHDRAAAMAINAQTLAAARRDLLGTAPIIDLNAQIMREIAARRGVSSVAPEPTNALELLRQASEVLIGRATVQSVAFGAGADEILFEVSGDDFRALDDLLASLVAAGLTARITQSGIGTEGGVTATLAVFRGAP